MSSSPCCQSVPLCARLKSLLHVSLNRSRFKDKNMQQFKVLHRPLCV
ncbi:hypothetical protein GHK48_25655 [Sinorhizobium fredii]|uniref:Uncharacterized protein n=1 Tax=Rhizobium fredii TaxID=380 RepID=A0A844AIA5_RHIFR|nr:hypothetical protein [Sinorhizobium fredii]MQX11565.1 hypothetical protein [Sinorhizobium fredii]